MMNSKEKQIFMLISEGYEIDEISKLTMLSIKSIDQHQKNILIKLNARTMPQAINNYAAFQQISLID